MAQSRPDDWPTSAEGYEIKEQIGQGAFAKVWKAFCPAKSCFVAVKILELEKVTSNFEDIRAEVHTMKMTNHVNVLTCYCSFVHKEQLWLVTPFMKKGSCLHVMHVLKKEGKGEGLQEEWIATILKEALQGLEYFHNNGQIHRDVKAGNLLLDESGNIKLADFGVSGWLMEGGDRRKHRRTFVGTPCWMAPEVMEQVHGYDCKADIWSLGITALELAKGYAPYARYQPMKVLLMTLQEDPPSLKSYDDGDKGNFSRRYRDMVKVCLQKDPTKRPSATTLLKHDFFKKARPTSTLRDELLKAMDNIGEKGFAPSVNEGLPGAVPFYVNSDQKYTPGTTWVFDDDEDGVKNASSAKDNDDMSIDDFAKEFESATGGEDFRKKSLTST